MSQSAAIGQPKSDMDRMVRVKYMPIASHYKGHALPCSVNGEDSAGRRKTVSAKLQPHQWQEVPVAIAKTLLNQIKKFERKVIMPDGSNLAADAAQGKYTQERDGVFYTGRVENESPDYELMVDGSL